MYKKQIEEIEQLATYYKKQKEAYEKLYEICVKQYEELRAHQQLSDAISACGLLPLGTSKTCAPQEVFDRIYYKYVTAEDVKNSAKKEITERKTIILDINLIPAEYKDKTVEETVALYEERFNVNIIPVDSSRANMQGSNNSLITIVL